MWRRPQQFRVRIVRSSGGSSWWDLREVIVVVGVGGLGEGFGRDFTGDLGSRSRYLNHCSLM